MPKTDPQAALAAVMAEAEKRYGKGSLHKASESVPVNRLPFVEPALNRATEGGVPFGRFTALYGDPSAGKSRVAMELIAQAQHLPSSAETIILPRIIYHAACQDDHDLSDKIRGHHLTMAERLTTELEWIRETFPNGADGCYYNIEGQFDPIWAKRMGVDLDRLMLFESTTIEEIVEMMSKLYEHYPLHILDSTSNASSKISLDKEMGKPLPGRDALQWKVCLRDSLPRFDTSRNMAMMIHQLSTNMRTGGSQPLSTRYMSFVSRLSLRFTHGSFLYERNGVLEKDKSDGLDKMSMAGTAEADGREVFVKIEKSTVCRPFRNAGLQWHYRRSSFVTPHELALAGVYHDIIRGGGKGGWYSVVGEDEKIGQGLKTVYARLADDEELRARITTRMLDFTDEM